MPELKKTRRCSIPRCFGTQTLTEIGNTGIPIPRAIEDRGFEKARYRKYRVWLCDRDPMHITRVEDIFTPIRPCTACGARSFTPGGCTGA